MSLFDTSVNEESIQNDLKNKIITNRIPINASVLLTNNCNFKCLHCYVQSLKNMNHEPLQISEWQKLFRELKNNGCIYLTLSGGEVLSAPGFLELYNIAYDLNFQIRIISNLSLLNEDHKRLFAIKKPHCMVVSLYGFSDKTYSEFCGVHRIFEKIITNIKMIHEMGIYIELQTVINTINYNEVIAMYNFAIKNKIKMNFFRNITCEIDGNSRPLKYQISIPQEIESYRMLHDIENLKTAIKINARMWTDGYKRCFAGITNCYIDYQGNMFLCNHMQDTKISLIEYGFRQCWDKMLELRKRYIEKRNPCSMCEKRMICGKCTPVFENVAKSVTFPFTECYNINELIEKLELELNDNEKY